MRHESCRVILSAPSAWPPPPWPLPARPRGPRRPSCCGAHERATRAVGGRVGADRARTRMHTAPCTQPQPHTHAHIYTQTHMYAHTTYAHTATHSHAHALAAEAQRAVRRAERGPKLAQRARAVGRWRASLGGLARARRADGQVEGRGHKAAGARARGGGARARQGGRGHKAAGAHARLLLCSRHGAAQAMCCCCSPPRCCAGGGSAGGGAAGGLQARTHRPLGVALGTGSPSGLSLMFRGTGVLRELSCAHACTHTHAYMHVRLQLRSCTHKHARTHTHGTCTHVHLQLHSGTRSLWAISMHAPPAGP